MMLDPSVQHQKPLNSTRPQFHTSPLTSKQPSVLHPPQFSTFLSSTTPSFQHQKFLQCTILTFFGVEVRSVLNWGGVEPRGLLNWGLCWTEWFSVLNRGIFRAEKDSFQRSGPFVLNWCAELRGTKILDWNFKPLKLGQKKMKLYLFAVTVVRLNFGPERWPSL